MTAIARQLARSGGLARLLFEVGKLLCLAVSCHLASPRAAEGQGGVQAQPVEQTLVSTNTEGFSGAGASLAPDLNLGGSLVAFHSDAPDLHRQDGDRITDVFVRDRSTGQMRLVSAITLPNPPFDVLTKGNGPSRFPSISADGRFIVYASEATNLVTNDGNQNISDIFLFDAASGRPVLVSLSGAGQPGNAPSDRGAISSNGGVVAFQSLASNLAGGGAVEFHRIHIRDLATGGLERIDAAVRAEQVDGHSLLPDLSGSGRLVVFESEATNLISLDTNRVKDVFVFDRSTALTSRLSLGPGGREADGPSGRPQISDDGRFVAYESDARNLVPGDLNQVADVFVHDLATGMTERVSLDPNGKELGRPSGVSGISADGRFVGFFTAAVFLPEDGNAADDFFVRDRLLGRTILVSATLLFGQPRAANGPSRDGAISGDGQSYAYVSAATDLSPRDPNPQPDVYHALVPLVPQGPFPPANNILLNIDGVLRQFDLGGQPTGRALQFPGRLDGVAVDDANAVWVLSQGFLARFQAASLEPAQPQPGIPIEILSGARVFGLVAARGFAWIASDRGIVRASADGELRMLPIQDDGSLLAVSLALDPFDRLWASVARGGSHDLLKLSLGLEVLHVFRRPMAVPFTQMGIDAEGGIVLRSLKEIVKLSRAGALVWSAALEGGGGLAVDGKGNAFTLDLRNLLGFRPGGRPFLRVPSADAGLATGEVAMAIDGEGGVYLAPEGQGAVLRFVPRKPSDRDPQTLFEFTRGVVGRHGTGDVTGFLAANISAQDKDADGDEFLNRDEVVNGFNPFDPAAPSRLRRLLPVSDFKATLLPGRRVRLEWGSRERYEMFFVFRDGRPIAGSPFPFQGAEQGVVDSNVPGGVHIYRVIGQGLRVAGGGGGLDPGSEGIPEPFSFSQEFSLSQGEGSILDAADLPIAPDAVAFDRAATRVHVALAGGILWTLDTNLDFVEEVILPADPFATMEVRGMAVDSEDATNPLFLLLADGRVYKRTGAADPVLSVTLNGRSSGPEGFVGLGLTRNDGSDVFAVMAGPGVDCLIGFFRTSGSFQNGAEANLTEEVLELPVVHSIGVSRVGDDSLLAGVGFEEGGNIPPTITHVAKLGLAAGFNITDSETSVPLGAVSSVDIPGFDFAPGIGLFVADRSGSRVVLLEALFPGSLEVLSVTPPRGPFDKTTPGVKIAGTGFGADPGALVVKLDGVEVPIQNLAGGVITIDAPALGEAREVTVEVSTLTSTDFLSPGFTYGFLRGDTNNDGDVNISDPLRCLLYLFNGMSSPDCRDAADSDDNEAMNLSDAIYELNYLFVANSPPIPPPFTDYGIDPTGGDILECGE